MGKPTVHDIAREANVSLATVDRVLNARPGVREVTVNRVQEAVRKLGYMRDLSAANLARQRQYRFAFLLPENSGQFLQSIRAELHQAAHSHLGERSQITIIDIDSAEPDSMIAALKGLDPTAYDGIALMSPETPQIRDAVSRLKADGLAVVTMVSDLPNSGRDHFVGIDNRAAGRTAAVLMGNFIGARSGEILVVTGSMLARDSIERRLGFDAVMTERFPGIRVLPSLESHGDPETMQNIVSRALAAHPEITGVYSLGSGNRHLLEALRRSGGTGERVVIGHELTPIMRQALEAGEVSAVITQNVGHLVRSALRVLRARSDDLPVISSQEQIRIEIVIRENLP